ncbi:hypothetical protein NLI96_g6356 [Meripilus lineatus]|uniref:F-box domain-containing protein n=1 Tax=Meripilus lineatus TaxID=2056292 RepID=A0AAD5V3I4_9APHY|nr:hypothetical protein NLI96_g6356 [Physisporinus lineatus]
MCPWSIHPSICSCHPFHSSIYPSTLSEKRSIISHVTLVHIGHRDPSSNEGDDSGGRDHGTGIVGRGTTSGPDSHRSSLLGLPQELIDLVIDHLASDGELHALQACCLTTSAWLPRIRSHLFGVVSLVPDKFTVFEETFRNSEAKDYVRGLAIEGGTEDDDEETVPRDGELTQGLLALFTNVEILRLSQMRWGKLRVDVQGQFLRGLPTLTVLHLTDVEFPKLTDLLSLARSYSELREIHLTRVVWSVEQGPGMISRRGYSPLKDPLHLEALSVYECTSPAAFVSSLLPLGYAGELKRISLEWGELDDPTILRDLIKDAGASLRSLAIDLSWQGSSLILLFVVDST